MSAPTATLLPGCKPHVILGLMSIGPSTVTGARLISLPTFTSLLATFARLGYTHLDTARVYQSGHQEAFTSSALSALPEAAFNIASKLYPNLSPASGTESYTHHAASLRAGLDASCAALKLEKLEIFYLHAPDRATPFEETLRACDELYREGKFRELGLSNYTAAEVAEMATLARERGWVLPRVYQALYNVVSRAIEPELVPTCRRFGVRVVVYNPIAGGLFTGVYSSDPAAIPTSGRFSASNPTGTAYRKRYFQPAMFSAVFIIQAAAEAHGIPLLDVALRWLVHHSVLDCWKGGEGDGVVIGVTSEDQLVQDVQAIEGGVLPEGVVKACDEGWEVVRREGVVPMYWHGKLEYGYKLGEKV